MAWRQCPRRLWLEVHHPELRQHTALTEARFAVGDLVGELARSLYDPEENGEVIDVLGAGPDAGVARTAQLLERRAPIFEAGLEGGGARAFVDVLRPVRHGGRRGWDLIEVKASASLKANHRDDVAIQTYAAVQSGLELNAVKLAHVDTAFIYRGDHDYQKLLREVDLTDDALGRLDEVAGWVEAGQAVVALPTLPAARTGLHCRSPHACGFLPHCRAMEEPVAYPVDWLPRLQGELRRHVQASGIRDMRELPDARLSPRQLRVKQQTLAGRPYFDRAGAREDLASLAAPAAFLDFEAVQLAIPVWPGTHPYQIFPFQFSLHTRASDGRIAHQEYIDLSGEEPSRAFAAALLEAVPPHGTVFVWNASFERARIAALADAYPDLRVGLLGILRRLSDLLAVAEQHYYHPDQHGSWKLKRVLPTIAADLDHAQLADVQDGHMAVLAYVEAIQADTAPARRMQLEHALRNYCRLDTLALVRIWEEFSREP